MEIRLQGISKRFTREWIFNNFSGNFLKGKCYAITGPNGSGKSTLLMIISGWLLPTEGKISYFQNNQPVDDTRIYRHIDYVAPYLDLIEDFTLEEFVKFHFKFNKLANEMSLKDFIHEIDLDRERQKFIRHFSSGMKQRLKLALGLYSQNPILFLDEPTSNLDDKNKKWYYDLFEIKKSQKLVILASNATEEYKSCDQTIKINDFKVT